MASSSTTSPDPLSATPKETSAEVTPPPPLSSHLIKQGFQIYSFLEATGRAHWDELTYELALTAKYIVNHYPRPELPAPTGKARQTKRSISAEPPPFPANWATDLPAFRRNIESFEDQTVDYCGLPQLVAYYRRHDSPSIGNTPDPEEAEASRKEAAEAREAAKAKAEAEEAAAENERAHSPTGKAPESALAAIATALKANSSEASQSPATNSATTNPATTRHTSAEEIIYDSPIGPSNMSGTPVDPAMQAAIAAGIAQYLRDHPPQRGPTGPGGPPGPAGPAGPATEAADAARGSRWNAADLGFFDPLYDGKSVSTGAGIEHAGKDTYFRDVHLFIERAKQLAVVKDAREVRNNLWMSLRGTALEWWTAELSDTERRITTYGNGDDVNEWTKLLAERFKEPSNVALGTMLQEKFTLRDAANKREPREFAQKIIRSAKDANFSDVKNQLDLIYNAIDPELRLHIHRPTDQATVNSFLAEMDERKHDWWAYASRHRVGGSLPQGKPRPSNDSRNQPGQYSNSSSNRTGYQPNFRTGYQPFGTARFSNNPPPRNQAYQSNQYQNQRDRPSAQQRIMPPQQRLQITGPPNASGSASRAAGNGPYPTRPFNQGYQNQGYQNQGYQNYQNRPPGPQQQPARPWDNRQPRFSSQRAYQATAEDEAAEGFDDEYDQSAGYWQYHDSQEEGAEEAFHNWEHECDEQEPTQQQETSDVNFVQPAKSTDHHCHLCRTSFPSRNRLFQHLKEQCWSDAETTAKTEKSVARPTEPTANSDVLEANFATPVIKSDAVPDKSKQPGFGFRGWKYATIKVQWSGSRYSSNSEEITEVCLDTGCSVTLIDRTYLKRVLPNVEIKKMSTPMPVRGVGNKIVRTDEYVQIEMFVPGSIGGKNGSKDNKDSLGSFIMEAHIVDDLKANMLIGIDNLEPQGISIDFNSATAKIGACQNLTVPINIHARTQAHTKRTVKAKSAVTVPARSTIQVPVAYKATPSDRDFLFEPESNQDFGESGGVFAHLIDSSMAFVQVHNATDKSIRIPRKARLGSIVEFEQEGAYMVSPENAPLAAGNTSTWKRAPSWKSKLAKGAMLAAAAAYTAVTQPMSQKASTGTATVAIDPALEHVLPNGITIYGTPNVAASIAAVASEYPEIWTDQGTTVDIPEEEWMPIPLKPGVTPKPARVYPVNQRDKQLIDETFDKLHQQGKMTWSSQPTPFSYPCFVVWREVNGIRKGRVVIDIRSLNRITENDSYPLPLQSDVTSTVAGYAFISICDAVGWFHQFPVQIRDRYKLTIVSHRGQEQSNVALMGYKGSPPYVQRQTDKLLRPYKDFAKAYVDDMVVYSKTLEEHLNHLHQIFSLYRERRVSLSPAKSFLGYPSVVLLGQRVDSLGLSTSEEKIAAISALQFPYSLRDLEIFLGLTGWLRSSIPRYAQRALPLQKRKTELTQKLPKGAKGQQRKTQSVKAHYDPTKVEIEAFHDLKQAFAKPTFLVHHDPARPLFIDLDASKAWGFAAMIYHVKGDVSAEGFPRTSVQPIMFLSKMLNQAEQNYWPTELEVAGIVWVVRKSRHMIESSKKPPTVVFTDHSAAVPISTQTSLSSSSTDKLNLRLVRASQYLSQFDLVIKHKSGKSNVVPDALSRLKADPGKPLDGTGILDSLYAEGYLKEDFHEPAMAYHITLVEMSDSFKERLVKAYQEDDQWRKILTLLEKETTDVADDEAKRIGLRFKLRNGLIYYTNFNDGRERICVPNSLEKHIFELAHNRQHHGGFHRSYDRIATSIYMRHLTKNLQSYIEHCPDCQLNQTRRHKPYGSLMPIDRPGIAIPFHTIAMDFIPALPTTPDGFDCLLTVTCKFSKRVLLIPGKTTWSAAEWADAFLAAITAHGWGIPCGTISDRDSKFMSSFWRALFQKLGTDLLTSTAYHPQTDGQSERTNQTVEIAMRFYVTSHTNIDAVDWTLVLPYLQGYLNNSKNQSTGVSPNEIIYGFNVRDTLSMLADLPAEDFTKLRQLKRDRAEESIAFANAFAKTRYDSKHQAVTLSVGDYAYLRLGEGYDIPGLANPKLHHQRIGPFKVLERVGPLAYRLQLAPIMRIYPVISVAQLEPAAKGTDPYGRVKHSNPPAVEEKDARDPREGKIYDIEALIGKRTSGKEVQYLVKWKGYGHQENAWYDISDLKDAMELVQEYEERHARIPARVPNKTQRKALAIAPKQPVRRGRPPKQQPTSTVSPPVPAPQKATPTPLLSKASNSQKAIAAPPARRSTRLMITN